MGKRGRRRYAIEVGAGKTMFLEGEEGGDEL